MRALRVLSVLPLLSLLAGCVTSEEPGSLKGGDSMFPGEDEQTIQLATELAMGEALSRPELMDGIEDVAVRRVNINEGEAHARLTQMVAGIPVFEGESVIHLGADGMLNSVTDRFVRNINVNVKPAISQADALDRAVIENGGKDMIVGEPAVDMQILRRGDKDHLTYRVQLEMRTVDDAPTLPVVFVDAHTGEVVWSYDNLQTAKSRKSYDAKTLTTLPGTLVRSEGQADVSDAVLNQAHNNAGIVWDYYSTRHARDSFDAAGATITSTVHYSKSYVNAFWNGTQMVYGDGDGVQSGPLTVLDVVGHEITHAVTERSSNLTYANESGALNEAMSDIFGASIEAFRDNAVTGNTWKIGEECWTPGTAGDSLRQMDDPALYGDYDYYPTRYTGTSDNGGVHWNSGIANLAFALAVKGGSHPRGKSSVVVPKLSADLVTGIQMGAAIFYKANTAGMTSGSGFKDARNWTESFALSLYGQAAKDSISAAWDAVGVPAPLTWTTKDTKTGLAAAKKGKLNYSYAILTTDKGFRVSTSGGTGDLDLYVRKGAAPTTTTYTCRSAGAANGESCTIDPAAGGSTYYIMLYGYAAFSGVTMKVETGK